MGSSRGMRFFLADVLPECQHSKALGQAPLRTTGLRERLAVITMLQILILMVTALNLKASWDLQSQGNERRHYQVIQSSPENMILHLTLAAVANSRRLKVSPVVNRSSYLSSRTITPKTRFIRMTRCRFCG